MTDWRQLPQAEFAFPGPLRDKLVAAILSGAKTTTTSLLAEYETDGEQLPRPGQRSVVLDSRRRPVAVIEVVDVRTSRLGEVDLEHAIAEGEGHTTVADWRADHEDFWHSRQLREALGDPEFHVTENTRVVLERFRLVTRIATN